MKRPKPIKQTQTFCQLAGKILCTYRVKGLLLLLLINCFSNPKAIGQATLTDKVDAPLTAYDEVPVRVVIDGYKMFYIDAIYGNNKLLFVNVEDLFNTLDIQCIASKDGNSLSGFIEKESQIYTININTTVIQVGNKIIHTQKCLAKELFSLYGIVAVCRGIRYYTHV